MKIQDKKKNSNYFGKSKRFVTESKYDKKPSPNTYKFDTNWLSKTSLMHVTSATSLKSVYYH